MSVLFLVLCALAVFLLGFKIIFNYFEAQDRADTERLIEAMDLNFKAEQAKFKTNARLKTFD